MKAFLLLFLFFVVSGAKPQEDTATTETPKPELPLKRMFIIPPAENNAFVKAQSNILKYEIKIGQESDTVRSLIDSLKNK